MTQATFALIGFTGGMLILTGVHAAPPSDAMREAAATATAQDLRNACAAVRPFYWEIGQAGGVRAQGSVERGGRRESDPPTYAATTQMQIASASKWIYGAYVVQKRAGVLGEDDVNFLSMRGGYTSFRICAPWQTVQSCLDFLRNGKYTAANDGKFYYGGGHMQKHAALDGLGPLRNAGLANEVRSQIGRDIELSYGRPQPAGGVVTTPEQYAHFLRKLLGGELLLGGMLGSHAVCANPLTCPGMAVSTPIPLDETWHYSLGHWVEDDPAVGDGAFSSAGYYGFYPWIDASKRYYGVLAREVDGGAIASMQCGRLIRKAWLTGVAH